MTLYPPKIWLVFEELLFDPKNTSSRSFATFAITRAEIWEPVSPTVMNPAASEMTPKFVLTGGVSRITENVPPPAVVWKVTVTHHATIDPTRM